jgi:hypothetical protein
MYTVIDLIYSLRRVHHSDLALQQVSHDNDVAARVALALLTHTQEAAVSAAIRVGLTLIAPILVTCALSAPSLPSSSCPPASTVATGFQDHALESNDTFTTPGHDSASAEKVEEWDAKGSPDLYGNEVIEAVARYKLDDDGSLYEVHSPQTELPRLTSPKG